MRWNEVLTYQATWEFFVEEEGRVGPEPGGERLRRQVALMAIFSLWVFSFKVQFNYSWRVDGSIYRDKRSQKLGSWQKWLLVFGHVGWTDPRIKPPFIACRLPLFGVWDACWEWFLVDRKISSSGQGSPPRLSHHPLLLAKLTQPFSFF